MERIATTRIEGACECMVIVHYKTKDSNEYKREAFLDPRHYAKWRGLMGSKLVSVKPVKGGRR